MMRSWIFDANTYTVTLTYVDVLHETGRFVLTASDLGIGHGFCFPNSLLKYKKTPDIPIPRYEAINKIN